MILQPQGYDPMRIEIPERSLRITATEEVDASLAVKRLRPPAGTCVFRVTAGLADVRWSDATIPDASTGHRLRAGKTFFYPSDSKMFRVFGGKVQVSYYEATA